MKKILLILAVSLMSLFLMVGCGDDEAASMYNDGTYTAYGDASQNSVGRVTIEVKDDEIVSVDLEEFRTTGDKKDENYGFEAFHDALEEMPGRFLEANSADVEAVTGATSSSEGWKTGVERALEKASVDQDGSDYFDGTFWGASDKGERGRSVAWVEIKDDKIVEVRLQDTTIDEDGNESFKPEDYQYEEYHTGAVEMAERFVEANGVDVETYTGATSSSENWIIAVERALEAASR